MGQHFSPVVYHQNYHLILQWGQMDLFSPFIHFSPFKIDLNPVQFKFRHWLNRSSLMPQGNTDTGQHLSRIKWLYDIVVRPLVQSSNFFLFLPSGGNDDYGSLRFLADLS